MPLRSVLPEMLWTLRPGNPRVKLSDWLAQAAKASGNLDLEKLLDMKEAGIEVESFVSEELRLQMYQKEVRTPVKASPMSLSVALSVFIAKLALRWQQHLLTAVSKEHTRKIRCHLRMTVDTPSGAPHIKPWPSAQVASVLSSGTGDFDEERILKELPAVLSLPERRVPGGHQRAGQRPQARRPRAGRLHAAPAQAGRGRQVPQQPARLQPGKSCFSSLKTACSVWAVSLL